MRFIIDTAWELVDGNPKSTLYIAEVDYRRQCVYREPASFSDSSIPDGYNDEGARTALKNFDTTLRQNKKGVTP